MAAKWRDRPVLPLCPQGRNDVSEDEKSSINVSHLLSACLHLLSCFFPASSHVLTTWPHFPTLPPSPSFRFSLLPQARLGFTRHHHHHHLSSSGHGHNLSSYLQSLLSTLVSACVLLRPCPLANLPSLPESFLPTFPSCASPRELSQHGSIGARGARSQPAPQSQPARVCASVCAWG